MFQQIKYLLVSSIYKYYLRPAYGSKNLLLEFFIGSPETNFQDDLFLALESLALNIESVEDAFLSDSIVLHINSNKGKFLICKDVWGYVIIMAPDNQPCIILINDILNKSNRFEKEEVDFENYKKSKG